MQREDAVKVPADEFPLENVHLGFVRGAPELAVQVFAAPGVPGVVLVSGGVAERIDGEMIGAAYFGIRLEEPEKI
jgi:hypothetical protein